MKLELGKISIKDIRFDDKTHVKDGMLYVNGEEVERLVPENDKLTSCRVDVAKSGESVRITPVKGVIKPRVEVNDGEISPGVIGKVSPQVGTGRTHMLEGYCAVTVDKIIGFQEGAIDMSSPAADYCPLSQTYSLYVVVEPADGLETHVYEKAARMAGLEVAVYTDEATREPEPDEIITHEIKLIFEQAAVCPDLPKVGYIHMLQSQGLLHDTYYYDVDTKRFTPTFMYPAEIMDGAIVSGNCAAPRDKATIYHHLHDPVIEDCYKHHGKDTNFIGVILISKNVFLADKKRHSDMVARLYNWMRLDGVLITEEGYDNPDTDLMMNYRKVERVGIRVVLIADEFPGKDGKSQSLANVCEEADTLASCGQGNTALQSPAMDKVIGAQDFIGMQIGSWDGCKNPDGSFETELQITITSVIVNDSNKSVVRGY